MSRQDDPTLPRYRLDNFFDEALNVVCDPDFDSSPSNVPLPLSEYVIAAPLAPGTCMSTNAVDSGHLPDPVLQRTAAGQPTESDPLILGGSSTRKSFYRARPLWLVPFAITVALAVSTFLHCVAPKV